MADPTISVILPTYQSVDTLAESVDSVLTQSWADLELVVIDDGSTDGSADVLAEHANRDPRIRILGQENQGAPAARNRGRAEARGRFLLFTDSDVVLYPELLERQLAALSSNEGAAYAYCDFAVRAFEGSWREPVFRSMPFDAALLRRFNYISAVSLVRSDLMPEWDSELRALQDWDAWLTLLDRGCVGEYVPEVLFETIDRGDSITQGWSRNYHSEALAAVRSKHARVMLVALSPVSSAEMNEFVREISDLGAGSEVIELSDDPDAAAAVTSAIARFDYVVVVPASFREAKPGWIREGIRVIDHSGGDVALFGSASAFGGSLRGRVLGRTVAVGEPDLSRPFVVPSRSLQRIDTQGVESLSDAILASVRASGTMVLVGRPETWGAQHE